jgi:hypothetical protein
LTDLDLGVITLEAMILEILEPVVVAAAAAA